MTNTKSRDAFPAPESSETGRSGGRLIDRFSRLDLASVGLLIVITTLAWCSASGIWSAKALSLPTAYLDPEKCDVVHSLADMKAASRGEFVPLLWKRAADLGAPFEANWNDWPMTEEFQIFSFGLLAKCCGLFAGLNIGMLLGHLLAAVTFYVVARYLGCEMVWSFVAALAYGTAPFLFAQSPHHITCVYAWHVPLLILVWRWVAAEPGLVFGTRRFWGAVAIAVVTGLQSPYFTNVFCQVTLLGAFTLFLRDRSWPALKAAIAVIGAAAVAFALMNVDTWTYRFVNGANPGAVVREYKWLEIYGLKLVDLVIPPVTHRAASFAAFAARHRAGAPLLDEGSYLGVFGVAALALLAWSAFRDAARGKTGTIPSAAWQVLWIVLCFTTGGLNAILGAYGFTLFRTGCRYSIVIHAIVLMYAAERFSAWQRDATGRSAPDTLRIGTLTAAVVLCLLVLWDQVPRGPMAEQQALIARQVEADEAFVADIEAALPEGAMIFQLPVMDFPESPLPGVPPYDHMRPYLYSSHLRYSFGSMKGRPREQWQQAVQQKLFEGAVPDQQAQKIRFNIASVNAAIAEMQKRGFKAIYVNRNGFPDRGKGLFEALAELGFDAPPIDSPLGDLSCLPLGEPATSGK
jgi:hypothetical protein